MIPLRKNFHQNLGRVSEGFINEVDRLSALTKEHSNNGAQWYANDQTWKVCKLETRKFPKKEAMQIFFSLETFFDINGFYNSQNNWVWAVYLTNANKNGGIKRKQNFSQKVMVSLRTCSEGVARLVILDEGAINHAVCIEKGLSVVLKYGNQIFSSDWVFQQNGAKSHSPYLTQ